MAVRPHFEAGDFRILAVTNWFVERAPLPPPPPFRMNVKRNDLQNLRFRKWLILNDVLLVVWG